MHIGDDLELSENYALVAYDVAATAALDACMKPHHHMVALIACSCPSLLLFALGL